MKVLVLLALLAGPVAAQEFTGLARLDVTESRVADAGDGAAVTLYLSQPVPYRAFTLTKPPRLVLDFREVDWRGADAAGMLSGDQVTALRFGSFRPGWSRLVADLAAPLAIDSAGMAVDDLTGTALLQVALIPVDDATFNAQSGAPPGAEWELAPPARIDSAPPDPDVTVIAIDAGHGGIDPGAVVGAVTEADLMLAVALELAEAVNRQTGFRAVLTRQADMFVPLAERMTIARAAGAAAMLSLHADALDLDAAMGASVYTLTPDARDGASARMAERHDRGDLLAGLDLTGTDDTIATALMDLARLDTAPRSARLADALVTGMTDAGAILNSRPRREAPLAVLNAADFPSVLVEVGFLTSPDDLERLSTPQGRAPIIAGLVAGLQDWAVAEAALAPLNRQ